MRSSSNGIDLNFLNRTSTGTTQKKETAEEGFTNDDGSVVVAKKMTRVVTTTRTTLPGRVLHCLLRVLRVLMVLADPEGDHIIFKVAEIRLQCG